MVELSRVPFSVSAFSEACMEDADPTAVTEVTVVCSGQRERESACQCVQARVCVVCAYVCVTMCVFARMFVCV